MLDFALKSCPSWAHLPAMLRASLSQLQWLLWSSEGPVPSPEVFAPAVPSAWNARHCSITLRFRLVIPRGLPISVP